MMLVKATTTATVNAMQAATAAIIMINFLLAAIAFGKSTIYGLLLLCKQY
jgi:hypothetical protein